VTPDLQTLDKFASKCPPDVLKEYNQAREEMLTELFEKITDILDKKGLLTKK
jgi:hypothetical protein